MKLFRLLLIIIGIAAVLWAGAFLFPSEIKVEKFISIKDTSGVAFNKICNTRSWTQWSPWLSKDTAATYTYFNNDSVPYGFEWKSEHPEVGNGKLTFIYVSDDSAAYNIEFTDRGKATGSFKAARFKTGCTVFWSMKMDAGYNVFIRYMSSYFKKKIAADFEQGLAMLKEQTEFETSRNIAITISQMPDYSYLYIKDECMAPEIGDRMNEHFLEIIKYMDRKHIIQKGFPFTIYHNVSDTMAFSVCIPFEKDGLAEGNIQIGRFTPAVAVLADYFGPYTTLGNAHVALQQWIAESQLEMYGDPIEMYVTGPPEWTDSTRWHTKIYYPVK